MCYYPQVDQETNEIQVPELDFHPIFDSPHYKKLARKVKIAKEDAMKLKCMREFRFGEYIEEVPLFHNSLYPCIPLPTSTARPFRGDSCCNSDGKDDTEFGYEYLPRHQVQWQTFSGQQLNGKMIPHTKAEEI